MERGKNLISLGVIRVILLLLLSFSAASQSHKGGFGYEGYRLLNLRDPDHSIFHFGLLVQYNQPWYHIVKSNSFVANDSFWSVSPQNGSGLSLAIMMQWNINKYVSIISNLAQIVLDYRKVEFKLQYPDFRESPTEEKLIETPYLQWPIMVKLQSDKIANKFRVYMYAGINFSVDIGEKRLQSIRSLLIQNNDWGFIGGIGFHFYFPIITISPQLQFSAGMNNAIQVDSKSKFNHSIQELYNRSLSLSIVISP